MGVWKSASSREIHCILPCFEWISLNLGHIIAPIGDKSWNNHCKTNPQSAFWLSRRCIIATQVPNGLPTDGRRTLARTSDRSELYELLLVTYFGTQELFLLVFIHFLTPQLVFSLGFVKYFERSRRSQFPKPLFAVHLWLRLVPQALFWRKFSGI